MLRVGSQSEWGREDDEWGQFEQQQLQPFVREGGPVIRITRAQHFFHHHWSVTSRYQSIIYFDST